jgi:RNase P/RNase MRP subunit POP5
MNCAILDSMCDFLTPQSLYLFGALLLLITILILLRKRQPKNIVAYKTENGNVTISRSAVVELVRTSCQQISQVNKPRLKVFVRKGLTHFTVRIQLTSGGRLKDVEETLQDHLRESLSKNLGIEKLGDINIIVTSFKSSKIRPTSDTSTAYTTPVQKEDEPEELKSTDESEKQ